MQSTGYRHEEILDDHDRQAQRIRFYGYLSASAIIGTVIWYTILSVPMLAQGMNPITVASQAVGYEQLIDDPMIVARESQLRLIEPAAGPAFGN